MARTIFKEHRAVDVKPGHITVDGIVLSVGWEGGQRTISHRHVLYLQDADSIVQVFGKVPQIIVDAIKAAMAE